MILINLGYVVQKLHKCSPENCTACINICPVESFYIPESAEEVVKYGKIACNEKECFYCGACENSCPDDLIVVKRKNIQIRDPKKSGPYPWIEGWVKNIKEVLRKALIEGKEQVEIPSVEEHIKRISESKIEEVPQLSEEDKLKLKELNGKIQSLLQSSKIRYWIKDKKTEKIRKELKKILNNCSNNQRYGVLLTTNCSNVNITSNLILNTGYGICLLDGCNNNNISFNYFNSKISLSESSYNLITNNVMPIEGGMGISLVSNSNYNVIKNNSINDSSSTRNIEIWNSRNNIISENSIRNIGEAVPGEINSNGGIDFTNVNNTIISNNIISNTRTSGIAGYGNNNTIEGNEINDTGGCGIWVEGNDNTYSKNSIVDNNWVGITSLGQNSVINDNFIDLNFENGIYLGGNGNIFGNTITNNGYPGRAEGIRIVGNNSLIWNNTLSNNWAGGIYLGGAYLQESSYNNTIYENNITGRGSFDDFGIKLFRSNNNTISKNILTGHVFALYLERSNYSNVFENVMVDNLKCIEEINCIENLFRDNSCDLDVVSLGIPGFNISFLIGVMILCTVIFGRRRYRNKH